MTIDNWAREYWQDRADYEDGLAYFRESTAHPHDASRMVIVCGVAQCAASPHSSLEWPAMARNLESRVQVPV